MKKKMLTEKNRMQHLAGIISEDESLDNNAVQVWFDLDGVLADMEGSLESNEELQSLKSDLYNMIDAEFPDYKGLTHDEIKTKFKTELSENPDNEDVRRLKKTFNQWNKQVFRVAGRDGFYGNLDLMPGAIDMIKRAHEITGNKPNVLTAPVGNENDPNNPSVKEKREWVSRHFGDLTNRMEVTIDKGKYANSENDILIDDRVKYVDKFTNGGGSAILFKEPTSAMKELEDLHISLTS